MWRILDFLLYMNKVLTKFAKWTNVLSVLGHGGQNARLTKSLEKLKAGVVKSSENMTLKQHF